MHCDRQSIETLPTAASRVNGSAQHTTAIGEQFTLADCAAAPSLFYADWVEEIDRSHPQLKAYRARLLAQPVVARAVDEARSYRPLFPLGAPDRD